MVGNSNTGDSQKKKNRYLKKGKRNYVHVWSQEKIKSCHSTHSFEWCSKETKATTITCDKRRTVKNSLRRSSQFRQLEERNKLKELMVLRHGKPIPAHFPCMLIQPGERLIVKYVKPEGSHKQPVAEFQAHTRSIDQLVVFNVLTKGGKNITKMTRNPAIRLYSELTVYAYKGEKVKHALKRDGRFLNIIFDKTCALSDISTSVNTEMSNLVDDLGGKTFRMIMLNKCSPPESQPSSLDDSQTFSESPRSDLDEDYNAFGQSAQKEQLHDNEIEEKPNLNKLMQHVHEIPGSRQMRSHLSSLVRDFLESQFKDQDKPEKLADVHKLLCVEYGRSQGGFEAKTMQKVMNLGDSVCQVRVNGSALGSGFLLFDTFVLTNGHVIKKIFNENTGQLFEGVTVHFSFKSLDQSPPGQQVLEVVAFEYGTDVSGHKHDWALLSLKADQLLPPGLLTHFGFLPQSGSICIIGHPFGGVQKVDLSWIIPVGARSQITEKHYIKNLNHCETGQAIQFFKGVARAVCNSRDLFYETCFYFGSSGSPIFDSHSNLVAMHSGGFDYPSASGEIQSIIEYGHSLSDILENLIIQLVQRERLDVLKRYLVSTYKHQEAIMQNVKKLVDSRNFTRFKNAINNFNVLNDDTLKMFFKFICKEESPVSMDIE